VRKRQWAPHTLNLTFPQSFHTVDAMSEILSVSVVVAALALIAFAYRAVGVFRYMNERPVPVPDPVSPDAPRDEWGEDIALVNARVDKLTLAVADGIERVARAENRIAKTVTSARRLVRENGLDHAGIEAEYDELQPRDAEPQPLPAMPAEVDSPRAIRIPGGHLNIGAA